MFCSRTPIIVFCCTCIVKLYCLLPYCHNCLLVINVATASHLLPTDCPNLLLFSHVFSQFSVCAKMLSCLSLLYSSIAAIARFSPIRHNSHFCCHGLPLLSVSCIHNVSNVYLLHIYCEVYCPHNTGSQKFWHMAIKALVYNLSMQW